METLRKLPFLEHLLNVLKAMPDVQTISDVRYDSKHNEILIR